MIFLGTFLLSQVKLTMLFVYVEPALSLNICFFFPARSRWPLALALRVNKPSRERSFPQLSFNLLLN